MFEGDETRVRTRIGGDQPLWVLVGEDGTLLCARHARLGLMVLSWTTNEEMSLGVERLAGRAPTLFETHTPEQRPFRALLNTAAGLGMRLRIDEFVVEETEAV